MRQHECGRTEHMVTNSGSSNRTDIKDALNQYIATDSPQWIEVGAVSVSVLLISQWRIELVISAVYRSGLSGFACCEAFSLRSTSRQVSDSTTCQ